MTGQTRTGAGEESRVREQIEIACDESGFSGGSLVGGSRVFAHASVDLDREAAAALVEAMRQPVGAPVGEYKAARLLRPQHRQVLLSLLGPGSQLAGHAHVHLTDTRFFVVARVLDVLLGGRPVVGTDRPGAHAATLEAALALHRHGEQGYGASRWREFLTLAGNLFRVNSRWLPRDPVPTFYAAVAELAQQEVGAPVREPMRRLLGSRPVAEAVRAAQLRDPRVTPLLEPVIPALTRTVQWWGAGATRLSVAHDEQSALTPYRIADIRAAFSLRHPGGQLLSVTRVDSRTDPRVQVADLVAGVARRLASDTLAGAPDPELASLLHPLVDPESVWVGRVPGALSEPEHHRAAATPAGTG